MDVRFPRPRHVQARIIAVPDIPRTVSGTFTELAVCDVIHGHEVKNTSAPANPEALEHFRNLEELVYPVKHSISYRVFDGVH